MDKSSKPILPPELWQQILSNLADYPSDLDSCREVSPLWKELLKNMDSSWTPLFARYPVIQFPATVYHSQGNIFRKSQDLSEFLSKTIDLDITPFRNSTIAFNCLGRDLPELLVYFPDLVNKFGKYVQTCMFGIYTNPETMFPLLVELSKLENLETLTIFSNNWKSEVDYWTSIGTNFGKLNKLSSLNVIGYNGFHAVVNFLQNWGTTGQNIKTLKFWDTKIRGGNRFGRLGRIAPNVKQLQILDATVNTFQELRNSAWKLNKIFVKFDFDVIEKQSNLSITSKMLANVLETVEEFYLEFDWNEGYPWDILEDKGGLVLPNIKEFTISYVDYQNLNLKWLTWVLEMFVNLEKLNLIDNKCEIDKNAERDEIEEKLVWFWKLVPETTHSISVSWRKVYKGRKGLFPVTCTFVRP